MIADVDGRDLAARFFVYTEAETTMLIRRLFAAIASLQMLPPWSGVSTAKCVKLWACNMAQTLHLKRLVIVKTKATEQAEKPENGPCPGPLCAAVDQILSAVNRRDLAANACRSVAHEWPRSEIVNKVTHTLTCTRVRRYASP